MMNVPMCEAVPCEKEPEFSQRLDVITGRLAYIYGQLCNINRRIDGDEQVQGNQQQPECFYHAVENIESLAKDIERVTDRINNKLL